MWLLLFTVGFLGFIVALGIFIWSFIKKDKGLRKKSLIGGLVCLVLFVAGSLMAPEDDSDSSTEKVKTEQTSTPTSTKKTSSSEKKEKTSSSSSKKKTTASSKKKSSSSSSSSKKKSSSKSSSSSSSNSSSSTETSSTKKEYDNAANSAFAAAFNSEINSALSNGGSTDQFSVLADGSALIDVIVPQNYKYLANAQIQQLADTLLGAKNNYFSAWNAKPENSYDNATAPRLYMYSPDGTLLAKESFWSGAMKREIDN